MPSGSFCTARHEEPLGWPTAYILYSVESSLYCMHSKMWIVYKVSTTVHWNQFFSFLCWWIEWTGGWAGATSLNTTTTLFRFCVFAYVHFFYFKWLGLGLYLSPGFPRSYSLHETIRSEPMGQSFWDYFWCSPSSDQCSFTKAGRRP